MDRYIHEIHADGKFVYRYPPMYECIDLYDMTHTHREIHT